MSARTVPTDAYASFVRRILAAYSRRIGNGDLGELAGLAALRDDVDRVIAEAVASLHSEPWSYSWTEIARELGISRQGARQRYGGYTDGVG